MAKPVCGECRAVIVGQPDAPIESDRFICPACGAAFRRAADGGEINISLRERIHLKKYLGEAKGDPIGEVISGDDLNRDRAKFVDLERHIDRANDRYSERIVDPETGEVIREVDEPLSEHRGRGDAGRKRRKQP